MNTTQKSTQGRKANRRTSTGKTPAATGDQAAIANYVYHTSFSSPTVEDELFGDPSKEVTIPAWTHYSDVSESALLKAPQTTVLGRKEEARLFLRYNYARYRFNELANSEKRKTRCTTEEMVAWRKRARRVRSDLVQANMALVLAMAKRIRFPQVEFEEMVSEGNMALLRSIDRFDVSRGYRFSTYACRAILKGFSRLATKSTRYRKVFSTNFEPELETSDQESARHETQWQDSVEAVQEVLAENLAQLNPLERQIVTERFGLLSRQKGKTLADIAKTVGLSTERVRQIINNILQRLRMTMEKQYLVR